jgi:hypothetical protein
MARDDRLTDFVGAALAAGRTRDEILRALTDAGWSDTEAADGLAAYAKTNFAPPVPAPVSVVSARDFFLYALIFVALALTAWHAVAAAHAIIDLAFGTALDGGAPERRRSSLNRSIAVLVVFAPLYIILSRRASASLAADPARHRSAIRRWTAALILLLTVLALLGTLAGVIYRFLQDGGDAVFLLKSAVTAIVAGAIFLTYRKSDA